MKRTVQDVVIDWLTKEGKKLYGWTGDRKPHQGAQECARRRLQLGTAH